MFLKRFLLPQSNGLIASPSLMPAARWIINRSGAKSKRCGSSLIGWACARARRRRAGAQWTRVRHRRAGGAGMWRGHHAHSSSDEAGRIVGHAGPRALVRDSRRRQRPAQPGKTIALENPGGNGLRFTRMDGPQSPLAPGIKDAAFVRFTSGTTGQSKGVVLTHRDVLERTRAANSGLRLTGEDKILWVLPMAYHFYVSIILYLEVGATVIVNADYLAENILDAAAKHQATFLYVTPMHVRMLNGEKSGRALPPSLKRVMSVSSRLDPQAARDFQARYRVPVSQGFGIIEVGLPVMNIAEAEEHPEAIGRPVPGFEATIVNEAMKPVAEAKRASSPCAVPACFPAT